MYSLTSLITLLIHYKYFILFPLLVIEGPVVTVMAAFLSSPGGGEVMNILTVFIIVVVADIFGDTVYYSIGRWGGEKVFKKLGLSIERVESFKHYFKNHGGKTIALGKISHGLGWPTMVGAGSARMNYGYFLMINTLVSLGKSVVFVWLGYYFGQNYMNLSHYVSKAGMIITAIILIGVVVYLLRGRKKANLADSGLHQNDSK